MSLNYNVLNNMEKQFGESFYILDSNKFSDNFDEFLGEFAKYILKQILGTHIKQTIHQNYVK